MRFISRVLPHLRRARPQIRYAGSAGGISTMAVGSVVALGGVAGAAIYYAMAGGPNVDEAGLREAIRNIMDSDDWDDGSLGPILVRLAWHASGTYCCTSKNGGSCGATMRYKQEATDGANAGLEKARAFLEPIKAQFPEVSYADLWILAGYVAIEEMGGPAVPFRFGRPDAHTASETSKKLQVPPNGRLPDAALGAQHVRDVFYRMGFNDREIVALVGGGHALGRCHTDRSGFDGPWTFAPTTFSNEYFRLLFEEKWTRKNWGGPTQFEDSSGALMMLPTDMANLTDPEFRKYSEMYMKDYATFESDFAAAWKKLTELGM